MDGDWSFACIDDGSMQNDPVNQFKTTLTELQVERGDFEWRFFGSLSAWPELPLPLPLPFLWPNLTLFLRPPVKTQVWPARPDSESLLDLPQNQIQGNLRFPWVYPHRNRPEN